MSLRNSKAAGRFFVLLGLFFSHSIHAWACGPNFPNEMLDRGDEAVLAAPIANFYGELQRIHLLPANYQAVLTSNSYSSQTIEADLADLRSALRKTELSKKALEQVVLDYQIQRLRLASSHVRPNPDAGGEALEEASSKPLGAAQIVNVLVPEGLPGEFADYFRGCIAWRADHTNEARMAWEALLKRPEGERPYRSTWAAYMLGKSWQGVDGTQAIQYFKQVRTLAAARFKDRLGLAASSLGWEAQEELRQGHFDSAIKLYLQQLASGDDSALVSLRVAAARALEKGGSQLTVLATNAESRRVITAFIISRRNLESLFEESSEDGAQTNRSIVVHWLNAVEASGVSDVESAEQLALAAYQSGQWEMAQRWIRRAKTTPVAQWLQAKLLLRSGKRDEAAALLERVSRLFPLDESETNRPEPAELKDNLNMPGFTYTAGDVYPSAQVLAEVGVLHLARREYGESLDALLRSGFWMDAAYVAERVLTLDELKNYVDRDWPAAEAVKNVATNADGDLPPVPRMDVRREIRYLLARRLTRMERSLDAREYYPAEEKADFDALMQNLMGEGNQNASTNERAAALFAAARTVREHGMELIGTEVEPDWHVHYSQFDCGLTVACRATNEAAGVLFASEDELQRARRHGVTPEARYHYRYQAASMAWEAAGLMSNNAEETARVLCIAGSWLKNIDAETADIFYKSLVRRCRKTDIGKLADRMRWFPDLDVEGNPVPWEPDPPQEMEPAQPNAGDALAESATGYWYVLRRGNTLQDVADAVRASHQLSVSVEEIQRANQPVNIYRLKAGQKIFVPASTLGNEEPLKN